jgi:hypothetical protein
VAASFEKLLQVLVLGCAYWRISDKGCSPTSPAPQTRRVDRVQTGRGLSGSCMRETANWLSEKRRSGTWVLRVAPDFARCEYTIDGRLKGVTFVRPQYAPVDVEGVLLLTGLVLLLGSGCTGGDGSKGDSAAGTHTNGGGEQATKADLDAALEKSFKESDAPGMVAAVQTPITRGCAPWGWRTALLGSR